MEAKAIYDAKLREEESNQLKELETAAAGMVREEVHQGVKHIWRLVLVLVITAIVLGAAAVGVAEYLGRQEREKREKVLALEQQAAKCFDQKDFACAQTAYSELRQANPQNETFRNRWQEASVGLAHYYAEKEDFSLALQTLQPVRQARPADLQIAFQEVDWRIAEAEQFRRQGDWQAAVDTLTAALEIDKADTELPSIIQQVYDEWIEYERASGNLPKALLLQMEKNVRFPQRKGE